MLGVRSDDRLVLFLTEENFCAMAKRPITDDLLNLAIETKLDAGVSPDRIHALVDAFAGDHTEIDLGEVTVGFLTVEDIAPSRRAEFLGVVLALSPEPKIIVSDMRREVPRAATFPVSLLSRAKAALRFAAV
jgi:hypothetical protein